MNAPINLQTIKSPDGKIEYVVVPYAEYIIMQEKSGGLIPNAVVGLSVNNGWSALRAWREHLGLTQAEIAKRLEISQSAYAQQESSAKLRKSSRAKIAAALGLSAEQLNF
jgi:DNA-binding XRE family transcriptional regulator